MTISEGRLFDFDNLMIEEDMISGFVRPLQISEVALEPGGQIFEHRQCCHEITYIISGEGFFYTNDNAIHVRRGDVHVISEGDKHSIIAGAYEKLRFICLGFKFREYPADFADICRFYERSPQCEVNSEGELRYVFDMLVNEFYADTDKRNLAIESLIRLILIKVYRIFSQSSKQSEAAKSSGGVNMTVYNIVKYIDSNIYNVKTVREIATALNYTENYISHIFKSKMGISLLSYIKKKKVEAVRVLLGHKNMQADEISELLHFDSVQSMSRAFKQEYGKTPAQYTSEILGEVHEQ